MNIIKYQIENNSPLSEYVFDFIFKTIGIRGQLVKENLKTNETVDIYYGNNSKPSRKFTILKNSKDIIWKKLINEKITHKKIGNTLKFDLINAIGLFLTDEVNKNASGQFYDQHKRLIFKKSFQCKQQIAKYPIVNLYVLFLKSLLETKFSIRGIPLWPNGKKCAIVLSHDVDRPIIKFNLYNIFRKIISILEKRKIKSLTLLFKYSYKYIKKRHYDAWLFSKIIKKEKRLNFKSTFFFASVNRTNRATSDFDVDYDIKKFKKIFKKLKKHNFEIGLHASYNSFSDWERLNNEKKILEKQAKIKITGLRHHCWHTGNMNETNLTLYYHEKSGFLYDTSLAFNEEMGFRRNVALPYYPYLLSKKRPLKTLQLPVFCMDGNLFYHPIKVKIAVNKIIKMIKIIKKYNGLGAIDWHVRTSVACNIEYINWGRAYSKIIKYISSDSEIWVTNLIEINDWIRKREKKLKLLKND